MKIFSCEEVRSFEGGIHLGRGALSGKYGNFFGNETKNYIFQDSHFAPVRE